ncbi:MAG TPA: hypothetical protein VIE46_01015 [Gemmatimonadales bacterium]
MTIPRRVLRLAPAALLLAACAQSGGYASGRTMEQGRIYTNWLYKSEYNKLWGRFTPELQRIFGSASELGAFAGKALTQLGREQRTVDEHVADLKPDQVYSRTSAFTAASMPMVIEWTLTKDGAVSGLVVRPASAETGMAKDSEK